MARRKIKVSTKKTFPKPSKGKVKDDQYVTDEKEFRKDSGKSKDGKFDCGITNATGHGFNDPAWYATNSQILKDAASFSYNDALGAPFRVDRIWDFQNPARPSIFTASIPGLMSIQLYPTPGVSTDHFSPINIAAQNIYSYVRYQNSGAANYNPPDLMMYLLAMDSLFSCWNWMKRIYGIASQYSQKNRYMPYALLRANGLKPDEIFANLSDLRAFINQCAARISAFCVPAVMPYFVRHSWLYSNVYKDSDTDKAQQYMFVPAIFYQYDETSSTTGTQLTQVNVCNHNTGTPIGFSALCQIITDMMNALQYSEDVGIMSGESLNSFDSP